MTSKVYCFLIDLYPTTQDLDEEYPTSDEDLKNDAVLAFGCFEPRLTDDNWWEPEAVVLQDGRFFDLVHTHSIIPEQRDIVNQITQVPQDKRWDWAKLFSLHCVAEELGFPWESLGSNFDTILTYILEQTPARVAMLWAKGPLLRDPSLPDDPNFSDRYNRAKWSKQLTMLINTMVEHGTPPFAFGGTPYDYRAFDLTDGEKTVPKAILFVRISI